MRIDILYIRSLNLSTTNFISDLSIIDKALAKLLETIKNLYIDINFNQFLSYIDSAYAI